MTYSHLWIRILATLIQWSRASRTSCKIKRKLQWLSRLYLLQDWSFRSINLIVCSWDSWDKNTVRTAKPQITNVFSRGFRLWERSSSTWAPDWSWIWRIVSPPIKLWDKTKSSVQKPRPMTSPALSEATESVIRGRPSGILLDGFSACSKWCLYNKRYHTSWIISWINCSALSIISWVPLNVAIR